MSLSTAYIVNPATKGINNGFGSPFSAIIYSATLAVDTDTTLTIPNLGCAAALAGTVYNKFIAVFYYQNASNVWVALNHTAALPAGGAFAAANSILNPPAKWVKGGDVIHFFSHVAATVAVELFSVDG